MIPKQIHYCWFGGNEKSPLIKACIKSWQNYMPEWEIVEWNERNSPIDHPFVQKALKEKKYAFAADYVRCFALYNFGGVYLDTDMEIIKDLSPLLSFDFFSAYEDSDFTKVSCGAIGSRPKIFLLQEMLSFYDENTNYYKAMPQILGEKCANLNLEGHVILPSQTFYPYNPFDHEKPVKQFMFCHITEETFGIHHWNYSWKFSLSERIINRIKSFLNS
ncbi:glycosyltransferase family 32 protein [Acinetobacter sp. ULE_I001]|uniref:glycosyltransferase family 32 protein n=1 Tax=unclassified Acinetobacter TaxID=196816 RepID=UPI003AF45B4A